MRIEISTHNFDITSSVKMYAEEKLGLLEKLIGRFDEEGGVSVRVTLERTTKHHHKGNVFRVTADMVLPGEHLRAEDVRDDIHTAIDEVKDKLVSEIEKYRTRHAVG